ncbi:putative NUDIX family NTP pyrophosphohydrolase [Phyllobacterium sp. 1468]|uniref:NUDIX domain-containing protein n=1 Tax=Phyllobacterium sp. 1468 TaxID=2817759 RepID=UPI00285D6E52|nr:NUDIX domain-containing protein [Phyllobacterium sp. 1468]MDR6631450.1 putative NUDIX family NTP pyrophosphohydrolase [Phyllobacterium sp. 1468]
MAKQSAGILMYRQTGNECEVLLVHPGGPFWRNKDISAWSIPKGEYGEGDDPERTARREFAEETGVVLDGELRFLGSIRQAGGKVVTAFALEGDFDVAGLVSNTFEIEWPPRSGRNEIFPEVDRAQWFSFDDAHRKIIAGQRRFLDRLQEMLERRID